MQTKGEQVSAEVEAVAAKVQHVEKNLVEFSSKCNKVTAARGPNLTTCDAPSRWAWPVIHVKLSVREACSATTTGCWLSVQVVTLLSKHSSGQNTRGNCSSRTNPVHVPSCASDLVCTCDHCAHMCTTTLAQPRKSVSVAGDESI